MKQASTPTRSNSDPNAGANSVLLGKRHEYNELSQLTLGQIAQKIGFTSAEITELERLYAKRFKEMK